MANKFTPVTEEFWVAPQLSEDDIRNAAAEGFRLIVNNRPDGEILGQPKSEELEATAKEAGLAYAHIPVGGAGITPDHVHAHLEARRLNPGKALAFCRSGTRSIFLGAYAAASAGAPVEEIIAKAAAAGYDVSAHRPALETLAEQYAQIDKAE